MVKCRKAIEGLTPYMPGKPIDEVKRELGLKTVIKLASNENPYGAPPCAVEAAKEALNEIFYYPDGACFELKAALSKKHNVPAKSLVIGAGADEIIGLLADTFIEAGDEAITGELTFGQYALSVNAMGGSMKHVPMKNDSLDLEGIINAVTPKTKMIFIANPNNPTGTVVSDAEKKAFIARIPNNVLIVMDEAYEEFVEDTAYGSSIPLAQEYDNLVVLKTFSKVYGLASLRVGYAVMNTANAADVEKIRKPFNVSIPAQKAAVAALTDDVFIRETMRKNIKVKHFCYKMLDKMGISYVKSETNFIAIDCPMDVKEAFNALLKKGYIVRPGAFGMTGRLRVTFGTMEQMEGFFAALKEVLQ